MALYVIGDTHFSEGCNKPMDIFGGAWTGYRDKLVESLSVLQPEDVLVLAGDFSWGMSLKEALADFKLISSFPGKKVFLKGNHDYWWNTMSKMNKFLAENEFDTIKIIHNNAYSVEGFSVAGSRGWFYDDKADKKIIAREVGRLETSLKAAESTGLPILVFLHYPPVYNQEVCHEIFDVIKAHNIKTVYHGHIHGSGFNNAVSEFEGIKFKLISADCIDFTPFLIV